MGMRLEQILKAKSVFLWDFDGCLCDSEHFHFQAYNRAFQNFGHSIEEAAYYPLFTHIGNGSEHVIRERGLSCTTAEIARLKNAFYKESVDSNAIALFQETPEIVKRLRALGAKVAIASNSPLSELQGILRGQGFEGEVDLIVGKTPELRKKPFPDLFLHALELLGAAPEDALVFEDTQRGLEAADAAGCEAVWIRAWHNHSLHVTAPHVASLSHAELLDLLRRLG